MRYVRDTSLNPYFTENASNFGATPLGNPACACARGIGDVADSGYLKLAVVVGTLGLLFYGINRYSKGQ